MASDGVTLKIEGLKQLDRALQQLPEKLRRSVIRGSLKEAAEPIRSDAARRAPRHSPGPSHPAVGHMADNIITTVSVTAKGANAKIGPSRDHYWGLILEYHPVRPNPFLRPAFEGRKEEALRILIRSLRSGVESEAKR